MKHRFGPESLYVLDEPEAALSPQRQLALLVAMHRLDGERIGAVAYRDTEHYALTRDFLNDPDRYLRRLLAT